MCVCLCFCVCLSVSVPALYTTGLVTQLGYILVSLDGSTICLWKIFFQFGFVIWENLTFNLIRISRLIGHFVGMNWISLLISNCLQNTGCGGLVTLTQPWSSAGAVVQVGGGYIVDFPYFHNYHYVIHKLPAKLSVFVMKLLVWVCVHMFVTSGCSVPSPGPC